MISDKLMGFRLEYILKSRVQHIRKCLDYQLYTNVFRFYERARQNHRRVIFPDGKDHIT